MIAHILKLYNNRYILKGILNQKDINHYTGTLINIPESINSFLIIIIYYYDDIMNYNFIKDIKYNADNPIYLENVLVYNPFILIYVKEN